MTIASEIQRIQTNIANTYDALEEKGATIPATKDVANLADCILTIPVGPGPSGKEYLVIPAYSSSNAPYIYSTDGLTWTQNTLSNSRGLMLATYAGNKYFLGSNESVSYPVLVSEDPSDSTSFVRANVEWIQEVAYGNNIYVGVSYGIRNVNISSDGINWTTHSNAIPRAVGNNPMSITFGNGVFVASFELNDSGGIYYSTDGLTWTQSSTNITRAYRSIIFDGTQFVVYGLYNLQVSTDGINWTNKTKPAGYGSIAYCNGVYTTGRYNNYSDTYTSTDLTNWTTISNTYTYSHVFSDGKAFYKTYGNNTSTSIIQTSTDGINWTNITVPSGAWEMGC